MSENGVKNIITDTDKINNSNIEQNIRQENLKRLEYILKEINFIRKQVRSNGGKIIFALNNEDSRKAIIQTMVNIYEKIKDIQSTNDAEIVSLFHQYELRALHTVRNITSHDSEKLHLGQTRNVINKHVVNVEEKIKAYLTSLKESKLESKELANEKAKKIIHQKSKTSLLDKVAKGLVILVAISLVCLFLFILFLSSFRDNFFTLFSILPTIIPIALFLFFFLFAFIFCISIYSEIKSGKNKIKETKLEKNEARKIIHQKPETSLLEKIATRLMLSLVVAFFLFFSLLFLSFDDNFFPLSTSTIFTIILSIIFLIFYVGIKSGKMTIKPADHDSPSGDHSGSHPLSLFRDDD